MNFFKGLYETTEDFHVYDVPVLDKYDESASELDIERNGKAKEEYTKSDAKNLLGKEVKKMSEDQEIILKENMWYNKLMEMAPFQYNPAVEKSKNRYLSQGGINADEIAKMSDEDATQKLT